MDMQEPGGGMSTNSQVQGGIQVLFFVNKVWLGLDLAQSPLGGPSMKVMMAQHPVPSLSL